MTNSVQTMSQSQAITTASGISGLAGQVPPGVVAGQRTNNQMSPKGKQLVLNQNQVHSGLPGQGQQQTMGGNRMTGVLAKEKVVLEGGGEFEEGTTYLIRSKDGRTSKMMLKDGKFIPYDPGKNISPVQHSQIDSSQRGTGRGRGKQPRGRGRGRGQLQGNATGFNMAPSPRGPTHVTNPSIVRTPGTMPGPSASRQDFMQQMGSVKPKGPTQVLQRPPVPNHAVGAQTQVRPMQPQRPPIQLGNLMPAAQGARPASAATQQLHRSPLHPEGKLEDGSVNEQGVEGAVMGEQTLAGEMGDGPDIRKKPDDPNVIVICQFCGYTNMDKVKCESCFRKFTSAIKFITREDPEAKRRKLEVMKDSVGKTIHKKLFYSQKLEEQTQVYTKVLAAANSPAATVLRTTRILSRGAQRRGRGRGRGRVPMPVETVTISSDEEEVPTDDGTVRTPLSQASQASSQPSPAPTGGSKSPGSATSECPESPLIPTIPISTQRAPTGRVKKMEDEMINGEGFTDATIKEPSSSFDRNHRFHSVVPLPSRSEATTTINQSVTSHEPTTISQAVTVSEPGAVSQLAASGQSIASAIQDRPGLQQASAQATGGSRGLETTGFVQTHPELIRIDSPRHSDYSTVDSRAASFTGTWLDTIDQTPRRMAEAGFFYTGPADLTRCFACGGGLKDWKLGDDPVIEHTRWYQNCPYINRLRSRRIVGVTPLDTVAHKIYAINLRLEERKKKQQALSQQRAAGSAAFAASATSQAVEISSPLTASSTAPQTTATTSASSSASASSTSQTVAASTSSASTTTALKTSSTTSGSSRHQPGKAGNRQSEEDQHTGSERSETTRNQGGATGGAEAARSENALPQDPLRTTVASVLVEMGYPQDRIREAMVEVRRQTGTTDVTAEQVLIWILDDDDRRNAIAARSAAGSAAFAAASATSQAVEISSPSTTSSTAPQTTATTSASSSASAASTSQTVAASTSSASTTTALKTSSTTSGSSRHQPGTAGNRQSEEDQHTGSERSETAGNQGGATGGAEAARSENAGSAAFAASATSQAVEISSPLTASSTAPQTTATTSASSSASASSTSQTVAASTSSASTTTALKTSSTTSGSSRHQPGTAGKRQSEEDQHTGSERSETAGNQGGATGGAEAARSENALPQDPLRTTVASVLVEMGYPQDRIREAMVEVRRQTGTNDVTAEHVLIWILDDDDRRNAIAARSAAGSAAFAAASATSRAVEISSPSTTSSTAPQTTATTSASSSASAASTSQTVAASTSSASTTTALKTSSTTSGSSRHQPGTAGNRQSEEDQHTGSERSETAGNQGGATGGAEAARSENDTQSMREELEKLRDNQTCKICLDQPVDTTFLPCGHLVCCGNCATEMRKCPICRKRIKKSVKTFMS